MTTQLGNTTASDPFSGHGYSGNDGFSGTKPLDDVILFTNSGITALVELFLENFDADLSKVEIHNTQGYVIKAGT